MVDLELPEGGCLVDLLVTSCIADRFRHSSMCLLKMRLSAATLQPHTGQTAVEPCINREEPLGNLVTVLHPGWENDVTTSVLIITTRSKSLTNRKCVLVCLCGYLATSLASFPGSCAWAAWE